MIVYLGGILTSVFKLFSETNKQTKPTVFTGISNPMEI